MHVVRHHRHQRFVRPLVRNRNHLHAGHAGKAITEQFGEEARDGLLTVKTVACGWDDSEHTTLRALRFPETASLTDLVDGRKAYTALWSLGLLNALNAGLLPDAEELTLEQLQALMPVYEESVIIP